MRIVLASGSLHRKEILERAGYEVIVDPSSMDESSVKKSDVKELVMELARGKAEIVAKRHPNSVIIAADTLVYFNGRQIGQSHDDASALNMLRMLLGKRHEVHSGLCVINTTNGKKIQQHDVSYVTLRNVSDKTLREYIASGRYRRKAGAYNIDDPEFVSFVEDVEGSHGNIKGLPAGKVEMMINRAMEE